MQNRRKEKLQCPILMPFKEPYWSYLKTVYVPAVSRAGLEPVCAHDWVGPSELHAGIQQMVAGACAILADLSGSNTNVAYEVGLALAMGKPAILVAENLADVPSDLHHLRILVYDKNDPVWGPKLVDRITRALKEAVFGQAAPFRG